MVDQVGWRLTTNGFSIGNLLIGRTTTAREETSSNIALKATNNIRHLNRLFSHGCHSSLTSTTTTTSMENVSTAFGGFDDPCKKLVPSAFTKFLHPLGNYLSCDRKYEFATTKAIFMQKSCLSYLRRNRFLIC